MTDEEHQAWIKAYSEGHEAYLIHGNNDANPYSNNDDEWPLNRAWHEGFMDAAWDD
jgi:hypothetical protein